jgi:hypothetical protein
MPTHLLREQRQHRHDLREAEVEHELRAGEDGHVLHQRWVHLVVRRIGAPNPWLVVVVVVAVAAAAITWLRNLLRHVRPRGQRSGAPTKTREQGGMAEGRAKSSRRLVMLPVEASRRAAPCGAAAAGTPLSPSTDKGRCAVQCAAADGGDGGARASWEGSQRPGAQHRCVCPVAAQEAAEQPRETMLMSISACAAPHPVAGSSSAASRHGVHSCPAAGACHCAHVVLS